MQIMLSIDPVREKYFQMAIENPDIPFEYGDITFVNLKRLYDFIEKNYKNDWVNFEEVIKEVIERTAEQMGPKYSYELGSHETKSGHAETISYEYENRYDEETDLSDETITF